VEPGAVPANFAVALRCHPEYYEFALRNTPAISLTWILATIPQGAAPAQDPPFDQAAWSSCAKPDAMCDPADAAPAVTEDLLYETEIRSTRPPLSAGSVEIDREELSRAMPASGSEAMAVVPGLRIVQHGAEGKGHQLFLRGFDAVHGTDVEVRVEGVVLNERANVHGHGYVDLYGVIPEAVRGIRVDKGSFLPDQGDFATAGTVSFELGLAPELRPGFARTDLSHRGKARAVAAAAPADAPADAVVAVESVYDRGFGPNREAARGALLGSWSWRLGGGRELNALGIGQVARWESPGAVRLADVEAGRLGFHGSHGDPGRGASDRLLAGLGLSVDGADTDLDLGVHGALRRLALEDNYTGYLMDAARGDRKRQTQEGGLVGADIALEHAFQAGIPLALLGGIGWRLDLAGQAERQIGTDGRAWRTNRELDVRVNALHASVGVRLSPWRWLELFPSVRGDLFVYDVGDHLEDRRGSDVLGVVSPRAAVSFPVSDRLTLFADYGRGLRSPEPRAIVAPNPGSVEDDELSAYYGGRPRIAVADSAEVGLATSPWRWLEARAAGFATFIDSETIFDHVSNTNIEMDGTRRLGVEVAAGIAPLRWLSLDADATFVDARFCRSRHFVPGTSPWTGRGALHLGTDLGVHGGADVIWSATRHLAHGAGAAGYAIIGADVGYRFEHVDVTLVVENLSDARSMDGAYHYASWFDRDADRSALPFIHYTAAPPLTARVVLTVIL